MASDIWLRTILIVRKETRCRHIGYSYRLTARVLLHAPSHRQDNTYHSLCYTSCGALAKTRNSSMGPPHEGSIWRPIAPWANALPLSSYRSDYCCIHWFINTQHPFIHSCICVWNIFLLEGSLTVDDLKLALFHACTSTIGIWPHPCYYKPYTKIQDMKCFYFTFQICNELLSEHLLQGLDGVLCRMLCPRLRYGFSHRQSHPLRLLLLQHTQQHYLTLQLYS